VVVLKKLFVFACVLAMLVLGLWFSTENSQLVSLVLLGFKIPALSLGVLVTIVLLFGGVLGLFVGLLPVISLKRRNRSLERQLDRRDRELKHFRKAPLKE